ncbi:N-ethylmaleimide reductase [Sphingomonas laterariae]|uniref:N-ethylmaleimide reductase n=1 Tax=Edaphosphingomonas laterariae TaxID=861865 RepID=A0A239BF59_9SPHN|nr:alkene reductase [Sphingomonas laterariae]SNS06272.1 N-ethylmaleimide reductase [Sphingomonas laterariae]
MTLFDAVQLGEIALGNRIVMAPMTRSRADEDDAPAAIAVEYYRQRASAGLVIAEGAQPSPTGKGYLRTPGIHSDRQIAAWRTVTDAVHAEGGRIVLQIMHVGRIASHLNKAADAETVAPSAIRARGQIFTNSGMADFDEPRALRTDEIPGLIAEFATASRNAIAAGFDGVELHCTSGYLPAQFLSTGTNHRTDGYGGDAHGRIRFVIETLEAMAAAVGAGRVGFRICPGNPFNDLHDDNPAETFGELLAAASPLGLAYLHLIDVKNRQVDSLALAKSVWQGNLILNESLTRDSATQLLEAGTANAFSFGRPFIANPDLVHRFRADAPLAAFNPATLYTPGAEGYTDYPAVEG